MLPVQPGGLPVRLCHLEAADGLRPLLGRPQAAGGGDGGDSLLVEVAQDELLLRGS